MPLQQLVEYFNDRLEQEHNNGLRPFVLDNGAVHGVFGPICIGSRLSPLRQTLRTANVIGHIAQLNVSTIHKQTIPSSELEQYLAQPQAEQTNVESIINFDRMSRAVHMLNYLPQAHLDELVAPEKPQIHG
ncbi:hypothetical protein [Methylomonas fluvii]|uniref:Uncharacterized protein n=1 Tax=Methylomonas fluvii TaxID=1854564 RepID=A0ABR9DJR1_9GAMM|nr:hypothetical protein [Methylomonas fluvii]MBD9363344.1 hypothetical protein [Methylomonas fluvii]CAD6876613.1 hypothetical protein [Methylomonas fluvii]